MIDGEQITQEKLDALKRDIQQTLEKHGFDNSFGVTALLLFSAGMYVLHNGESAEAFADAAKSAADGAYSRRVFTGRKWYE